MQTLYGAPAFGVRRGASPPHDGMDRPRTPLHRRLAAALFFLVASLAFGWLPTAANAAWWNYGTSVPTTQPPWWSYLPGYGGSTTGGSTTGGATTGGATTPPSGSSLAGKLASGSFNSSAGAIPYQLYVPSTYKPGTAMPLVVALHGCTQSADIFRQLTGWDKLAEAQGFIVLFPQQDASNNNLKCWNFFQTAHMNRGSGEPARIAELTQWVQSNYGADTRRTYVNGLSAGGAMTSVMSATYPDVYAAGAIGSGCEYAATATCAGYKSADPVQAGHAAYSAMGSHARVVPLAVFQGDQDTTVPPVNAQQAVQQWQTTDGLILHTSVPSAPTNTSNGTASGGQSYTVSHYGDGQGHELIESWLVHGMNHAWSGGNSSQQYADPSGPDETAAMYAFFVKHPMT
jgi:poly(hydroxyalkanoate) depolymerase family esterase